MTNKFNNIQDSQIAIGNNITQSMNNGDSPGDFFSDIDMDELVKELSILRKAIKQKNDDGISYDEALDSITSAEIAAKNGDRNKVVEFLKKAGKPILDIAIDIGTTLVAKIMENILL